MSSIEWPEAYRLARSDLLVRTREMGSDSLHRYTTLVTDVTELVLLSDDAFRLSERCQVFDTQPGRGADALARARRYNDRALGALREDLPAAIEAVREEVAGLGHEGDMREAAFAEAEEIVREASINMDLTVNQAREARSIVDAKFEAGRQGPGALCDSALDDVRRLVDLRERREARNDPVATVLCGLGVIALVAWVTYVTAPGGPGWNVATIALAVVIVAFIGVTLWFAIKGLVAAGYLL